ncbi:MAG: DASS family sodium-coupled anion symporter [Betaproteobacteria bacterium]
MSTSNTTLSTNQRIFRFIVILAVGVSLWTLPVPAGINHKAWELFAIFVATILGLILQPLPMGAMVLIGMSMTALTETLSIADALNGFANGTVWLIFTAFLFARAFAKTGLGRRIAYWFIRAFGHKTLGLAYALAASDLVLAPGIPSGAARTGGVLYPIVRSLSSAFGSEPGESAGKIGRFLHLSTYQAHGVTCAMFMTAMAANPLIVEFAKKTGNIEINWGTWALAGLVPGLLSLLVMIYVIYKIDRPLITETPQAAQLAREELAKMGAVSRDEWVVLGTFALALLLWITGSITHIEATVVALLGLCLMLLFGTITWDDVLAERTGWDTLIWFGGLVGMATMLAKLGLFKWFSIFVTAEVTGMPWLPALVVILLVYNYSGYLFASLTAHTLALYVPMLTVAIAVGAPPLFAALLLAFFSSLCVSLTHYAGGPAPVYFGSGYVSLKRWWSIGFLVSLINIVIWLGVGSVYWKMLGLY